MRMKIRKCRAGAPAKKNPPTVVAEGFVAEMGHRLRLCWALAWSFGALRILRFA